MRRFVLLSILAATVGAAPPPTPPRLVSVNEATEAELMSVPGVTADVARRIVKGRPYQTIDQLVVEADLPLETVRVAHQRFTLLAVSMPAGAPPQPVAGPTSSSFAPINVNTATEKTLREEIGLDPASVHRVIAARPFERVEQFLSVAHIDPERQKRLWSRLVVADPLPVEKGKAVANATVGGTARPTPVSLPLAERLDVNTVSAEEIMRRCGLDPMTANRMVRGRPYASFAELRTKMGMSKEQSDSLSRCVRVIPPSR